MENKRLPQLCEPEQCTACSACFNVCPKHAIQMVEDECGELHPQLSSELCIGCGLCERTCPELKHNSILRYGKPDVYCCWLKESEIRKESTSGGAAYALSYAIIQKGGHVWGAAYDEDMSVCYQEANTLNELKRLQKSKYVQSYVKDSFRKIKQELDNGDWVLFTGTGCHVKGLRSFLKKDYPNLYTVDLVCHGVPGQGVFMKYVNWLELKFQDKLIDYIPRHKRKDGQEIGYYTMATFKHRGDVKLEKENNGYFIGFQHNIFLRSNCFKCTSNGEQRYADFTVADFWGLGKVKPFRQNAERTKGISMLALNSDKAKLLFEDIKDQLFYELRSYEEASFSNTQYYKPAVPSPRREAFRREWKQLTWEQLTEKYFKYTKKEIVLYTIKKITPPLFYLMLNHWRNGSNKKRTSEGV